MSIMVILVICLSAIIGILIVGFNELHKAIKAKDISRNTSSLEDLKLVLEDILQAVSDVQTEISLLSDKMGH